MDGQLSIFDYLETLRMPPNKKHILSVGDKVGRIVLGECRIATVKKVEGLPKYPFYRTDHGCYSYEEGLEDVKGLEEVAKKERAKYKTIIPENLASRVTVEYEPRRCDGYVLWAQIGIMGNMLFWKEDVTYQFMEPYDDEKKLKKEYEKHKKKILDDTYNKFRIVDVEHPMRRLYWSQHGFYADAEYVKFNG